MCHQVENSLLTDIMATDVEHCIRVCPLSLMMYMQIWLHLCRYSIPMDMTVVLGLHKFSLQATIDHHGPSMYPGHYTTASINCCKNTFYCNDSKITELKMIDTKNSSTAYVVMYKLIT